MFSADTTFSLDIVAAGDVDADGFHDFIVRTPDCDHAQPGEGAHLIYGGERLAGTRAPEAFERGFDPEQADAAFSKTNGLAVGDRDGDGDDELMNVFRPLADGHAADVAFASGSRRRFSGEVSFPNAEVIALTPNGRYPDDPARVLSKAIPAGDLDGDGTADLFTTSHRLSYTYASSDRQVHIHYGSRAKRASQPR